MRKEVHEEKDVGEEIVPTAGRPKRLLGSLEEAGEQSLDRRQAIPLGRS
jgi:hypothetical protein